MDRRSVLIGAAGLAACATAPDPGEALAALEARSGGRLGVFARDAAGRRSFGWRADERFGLCSTFKLPLAAAVLAEADAGRLSLAEALPFGPEDMVSHAPVTQPLLAEGRIGVGAAAEGAQKTSDNVAANLLIRRLGGLEAVTAIWRGWGDRKTRLDRFEPAMNLVPAGEVRDTTTPRAMAGLVSTIFAGEALSPAARATLAQWTVDAATGLKRLRAGFPQGWRAGDKTGTASAKGMANKVNDVAIVWPPGRGPIVVAAYFETPEEDAPIRPQDEAVLAEAGRIAAAWIG